MFLRQLTINIFLYIIGMIGIVFNRRSILIILMCIELMLLSLNLNFIVFSVYFDDLYGQLFSLFILTVAASESAVGLAIIIIYYSTTRCEENERKCMLARNDFSLSLIANTILYGEKVEDYEDLYEMGMKIYNEIANNLSNLD